MRGKSAQWVIGSIAVVLAVLFGSWLLAFFIAVGTGPNLLAKVGQVGDAFGLAGAVFSGIGLVGVALALFFDTKDRRRSRRPFLTMNIANQNVELRRAKWESNQLEVRIRIVVELSNESPEPALNISTSAVGLPGVSGGTALAVLPMPLGGSRESKSVLHGRVHGARAEELLRDLKTGNSMRLELQTAYESLNGVKWVSKVALTLKCDNQVDQQQLADVLDRTSGVSIDGNTDEEFGPDAVVLRYAVVEGTWSQAAV